MSFLDVIPHSLFRMLSSSACVRNAIVLERIYEQFFDDFNFAPKKTEVLQVIRQVLDDPAIASIADQDEIDSATGLNEYTIYNHLRDDGWVMEVADRRSVEVHMPREAHALMSAFITLKEELKVNISAEASLIDSGILAAYQDPAGKVMNIISARRQAVQLRRSIDGVLTSLHRIEEELMKSDGLADLLGRFMDHFVEKLLLQDYRLLKASSYNPMRFQRSIRTNTERFMNDEGQLSRAAVALAVMDHAARAVFTKPPAPATEPVLSTQMPTRAQRAKEQRRDRRLHRYESVMELVRKGMSQREISSVLGVDRRTVRRWTRACGFPERKSGRRRSAIEEYRAYLDQRRNEGCHNAAQLWREMRDLGFRGTGSSVRHWIMQHYGRKRRSRREPILPKPPRISPRQVAWHIMKPSESSERYLKTLFNLSPEISACAEVAREFFRIVRTRDLGAWPKWRDSASRSLLASFAKHICRDEAAVRAALEYTWSNGPVEGNVHRLKLIKRSMYGRASFELLRARVLSTA